MKEYKYTRLAVTARDLKGNLKAVDGTLDLNHLNSLTVGVIKQILLVESKELLLNGISTLSPEAARELFKYPGESISLRGVDSFSLKVLQEAPNLKGKLIVNRTAIYNHRLSPDKSIAISKLFHNLSF